MNRLIFPFFSATLLLAGCSKNTEQKAELAVQDFIRTRVSDARNYFPGKFRSRPYTKRDSLQYLAQMAQINGQPAPPAPTPADSVRIGTLVLHDYRDEMRNGVSVRDSGEYVVRPNGQVRILIAESIRRKRLQK